MKTSSLDTKNPAVKPPAPVLALALAVVLVISSLLLIRHQYASDPQEKQLRQEIAAIRRLAAGGDLEALATRLDQSVILIPAGELLMGDDDGREHERPQRRVYLDAFEIDRYEVTNAQYRRFLLTGEGRAPRYWSGLDYPAGQADYPVAGVGWVDALAYCEWLGKSLPSEAQWEKACRGAQGLIYPWGNRWDPGKANLGYPQVAAWPLSLEDGWSMLQATPGDPTALSLQPVGSYPQGASPYGVLDLVGNVSEWTLDWYNWDGYADWPTRNPVGLGPPWNHCLRGSGWFDRRGQGERLEQASRCAARNSSHSYDDPRLGFRCAKPLQ